ncbi:MAG: DUF362 domain-containing protein [Desulfarculus sp.]|jgi:uncharacterized protein (DUF362 family)|nr:MAG: DUF362 domain-containing protein [Desulfarculus sp.]
MHTVSLCHNLERPTGVRAALAALGPRASQAVKGQEVLLKPNFNTADPAPGSTHNDTLAAFIEQLWNWGAASITLGERSWQPTARTMAQKGVGPILERLGVKVIVFDDLPQADWVEVKRPDHHWPQGFRVARPVLESPCLVETCCLKTHQYGGVFTMSLKLAVGVVPGRGQMPAYMEALHSSPHQRRMIAEINTAFAPRLILLDGVEAFVDGGPATGSRAAGEVMLAGFNPVAVDAAGVACLKHLGSNAAIMGRPIFAQEQIARAVELGLGPAGPTEMELKAADPASQGYASAVGAILAQG